MKMNIQYVANNSTLQCLDQRLALNWGSGEHSQDVGNWEFAVVGDWDFGN